MSKIIEVDNLIKKYNKTETNAVDGISFSVEEGEFFTLLGPNGAGKTTTISILTTVLSKTDGVAKIAGFDIDQQAKDVRQEIGIIFQTPSLDENLTAEENVRFHAILYNLYPFRPSYALMPEEYQHKIMELAEVLGIKDDIFNPIKTFSGGMKRKLEIIRGLMHQPRVLFLDEPTTGLDPASRKNLWNYLQRIRKEQNITVFLTTHYLEEAEGSDKVCILHNGRIISMGTPREIKKDLVEHYLILDADNKESLQKELKQMDVSFHEHDQHFHIQLNGHSVQKIIKDIDTELTLVETHTPTLEEAYLSIIEEDEEENIT